MPQSPSNSNSPPGAPRDGTSPPLTPEQWLKLLSRSDQSSAQILAMEVWSIAKTMDAMIPGFWGRFMANRQVALRQFLQHKQQQAAAKKADNHPDP